jgi:transcriptional regulator with XRE-family HTH domain
VTPYLRLRYERHRRGWSQDYVVQRAAHYQVEGARPLTQTNLSMFETDRMKPTAGELETLALIYDVRPKEILMKPLVVRDPEEEAAAS